MATVTKGRTFVSGETVTPAKLNELVDNATVSSIVNADVSASAAIDGSKISPNFLSTGLTLQSPTTTSTALISVGTSTLKLRVGQEGSTGAQLLFNAPAYAGVIGTDSAYPLSLGTNATERVRITETGDVRVASAVLAAPSGSAPLFACRAWVNFDGTSVTNVGGEDRCTVRESGNVSKVVRSANGRYTIHFSTAMPDANYCAIFTGNGGSDTFGVGSRQFFVVRTRAAGSVQVNCIDDAGSSETNPQYVGVAIFR